MPNREALAAKINKLGQQSTIYYANGTLIHNVQAGVIRSVTSLSDISPNIVNGLVSTEDSFYEHKGQPKAILRATHRKSVTRWDWWFYSDPAIGHNVS